MPDRVWLIVSPGYPDTKARSPAIGSHSQPVVSSSLRQGSDRRKSHAIGRFWAISIWVGLAVLLPYGSAVDCRIQVRDENGVKVVTIAGRLMNDHVPGLLSACGQPSTLRLDLTDVLSVDAIAAEALRRLRDAGAQLTGVPTYIQLKLDSIAPQPRPL